jgi:spore coat polysaccharide biosynthesis protein SpsF
MSKNEKPNVVAIVQARMGATRLPGKPLKQVMNRPLLSYQIERLRRAKSLDNIVIATTTDQQDQKIVALCEQENIPFFRGSPLDVLDRYYQAAKKFKAEVIVRITGDCPIIDPSVVDLAVDFYLKHHPAYDYVSNSLQRTYPRGLDVEVFNFKILEKIVREAQKPEEREHVTPYIYEHPEMFTLGSIVREPNESHHRWTVDTEEDFQLIEKLITSLYPSNPQFTADDVLQLLREHPDWVEINAHVKQKPLRESSKNTEFRIQNSE